MRGSRSCSDSESVEEILGPSCEKEDCCEGFRSIGMVRCCRCCLEMEMGCFDICWGGDPRLPEQVFHLFLYKSVS